MSHIFDRARLRRSDAFENPDSAGQSRDREAKRARVARKLLQVLRHAFAADERACPRCGGGMEQGFVSAGLSFEESLFVPSGPGTNRREGAHKSRGVVRERAPNDLHLVAFRCQECGLVELEAW